jgi:hypothetical protein
MVNTSLQMNCQEYNFIYETDVVVKPGNYKIEVIAYSVSLVFTFN